MARLLGFGIPYWKGSRESLLKPEMLGDVALVATEMRPQLSTLFFLLIINCSQGMKATIRASGFHC